ncbi:uridine kinase [Sinosporangium album]|uniref:Uridine kinase n=1 Tax=Sinosporangium album TaxID=504805 RepID=A0A1G7ZKZ1_9ACTN|nr:hypothetical protein [Sinosporangium album]SDH09441.1 uridine kinase [Sinosporangium album]
MAAAEDSLIVAIAGIPGSGKSTVATRVGADLEAPVIAMDTHYHPPAMPGAGVDFSDPDTMDVAAVLGEIDRHTAGGAPLVVVEGIFALTLPEVRSRAGLAVWMDVPWDIGLARKLLRKLAEGADVEASIRGYLERGRSGYERHVEVAAATADLCLDGQQPAEATAAAIRETIVNSTEVGALPRAR